ncbi:hypothetical protein KAU92_06600, partial [Candidatus Bathyarchaeota archaeon]|nr:hypothetical protein [Candidatus Bathyarchaeota archaeon]
GNTAAIYENLTDEDAEKEYLAAAGLQPAEETADPFSTVKCSFCGEDNAIGMKYCGFCGVVLDSEAAEKMIKREQIVNDLLALLSKPGKLDKFMEKMDSL